MGNNPSEMHVLLLNRLLIFLGEILENKQEVIIISRNKSLPRVVIQGNLTITNNYGPHESVCYSQLSIL